MRRKLSARYKHRKLSMVFPVLEMHEGRGQGLILGLQKKNVIIPATKNTQFRNVMCSKEWNIKSGTRRRNLDCVTIVWGRGTWVSHVFGAESAELMDVRTITTGYFMRRR